MCFACTSSSPHDNRAKVINCHISVHINWYYSVWRNSIIGFQKTAVQLPTNTRCLTLSVTPGPGNPTPSVGTRQSFAAQTCIQTKHPSAKNKYVFFLISAVYDH